MRKFITIGKLLFIFMCSNENKLISSNAAIHTYDKLNGLSYLISEIMIGFELNLNGEKIAAGLGKGVVSIIVTKLSTEFTDSIDIDFTGLDLSEKGKGETMDWLISKLKVGDELKIKVTDVLINSKPIEIRKKNRDSENERKLKSYNALRKELGEKGLI